MNYIDYLDFELEIGPPTGQEYPLTVLHSPAGEARATLAWPFGELALENRLKDLQIALLSSGGVRRTVLSPAEEAVQRFGAELFDLLFTGEVRNRYDVSQERVHHQGKGLRVKLRIQAPLLANLPWEFLYDSRRDGYICLSHQTPLVRYLELPQTIRPLAVTPPLRILGMIASPSDLQTLDIRVEQQRLERAIAPLQAKGLVQLHWLEGATWRDLQRTLRREQWHIFHFVGHGMFDPRRDEGLLAFCNDANQAHLLTAGDLGRLLADHRTLRLAVLNACLGAQGSNRDLFASTAATLVRRGILAVVAMQQAITDAAAIEFTQTFYESLADGLPVDAAMGEARKAISFAITNTLEWGTPVLYSRASDGVLFTVDALPSLSMGSRSGNIQSAPAEAVPSEREAKPEPPSHEAKPTASTNLPGRGEEISQNQQPSVAPSRKVNDGPPVQANPSARPITHDKERVAAEKATAERVAKRIFQDGPLVKPDPLLDKATLNQEAKPQRTWLKIIIGLIAVVIIGFVSLLGVESYQRTQRNIAATATQQALYAAATALAPNAQVTATAVAQRVEAKMLTDAPQLQPLAERFAMQFVHVPAGDFLMGSLDGTGDEDERPQFMMPADDFWIGLTEITNGQYKQFMDAGGYDNQTWWTEAGRQWKTTQGITQPAYWTERQWNGANQPVVGVSWYEAMAYAAWLAAETGLSIRLPTEAEWEKVARGTEGQLYPWGDESPNGRLLNFNDNIRQTVDVGSYAAGVSPYGALDMAGNVWEWTATKWVSNYENYANVVDNDKGGDAKRALRGGSWRYDSNGVRSTNRFRLNPDYRGNYIGFRLVVFAPGF